MKVNSPYYEPEHILAVDFDHTICISDYPKLGRMRKGAKEYINKLYEEGYGIVINTCREGVALADAIKWMDKKGIKYHYANCNFPHLIRDFKADCRKISASVYIDDKNLGEFPSWEETYKIISKQFKNDKD